jgi:hypothetical protein
MNKIVCILLSLLAMAHSCRGDWIVALPAPVPAANSTIVLGIPTKFGVAILTDGAKRLTWVSRGGQILLDARSDETLTSLASLGGADYVTILNERQVCASGRRLTLFTVLDPPHKYSVVVYTNVSSQMYRNGLNADPTGFYSFSYSSEEWALKRTDFPVIPGYGTTKLRIETSDSVNGPWDIYSEIPIITNAAPQFFRMALERGKSGVSETLGIQKAP